VPLVYATPRSAPRSPPRPHVIPELESATCRARPPAESRALSGRRSSHDAQVHVPNLFAPHPVAGLRLRVSRYHDTSSHRLHLHQASPPLSHSVYLLTKLCHLARALAACHCAAACPGRVTERRPEAKLLRPSCNTPQVVPPWPHTACSASHHHPLHPGGLR
jgi:hypothetical protein